MTKKLIISLLVFFLFCPLFSVSAGIVVNDPKYSEQWYRLWYNRLDMKLVKKYYDTFKSADYPEFPDDITYDSKLTKVEGWVVKEAVGE